MSPRIIPNPRGGGTPGVDTSQAGFWAPALGPFAQQATGVVVASRCYYCRTVCPVSQTITKIGFAVNTAATADDPCDVGIYAADATRLGSSGSTLGQLNSTGVKQVALSAPITLIKGTVYYAAFASGPVGGTAAAVWMDNIGGLSNLFGGGYAEAEHFWQPAFPLPALATSSGSIGNVPLLALVR
jgi:hypothetical protein